MLFHLVLACSVGEVPGSFKYGINLLETLPGQFWHHEKHVYQGHETPSSEEEERTPIVLNERLIDQPSVKAVFEGIKVRFPYHA